ncbi:S1-like domain-containing RNA-binding protein [Aerococcaceae bacterium WGS1372]
MVQFGEIIEATVTDENGSNYFAQSNGFTYMIPKKSIEDTLEKKEVVEGLIYQDKDGTDILQIELPDIRPGIFGWGKVIQSIPSLGIFVDVGLINKDIVVSLDDLPEDDRKWPRYGDKLYLTYRVDDKNRFWGVLAQAEDYKNIKRKAPSRMMNQEVSATVINDKGVGVQALSVEGFEIFVHQSEMDHKLRVGELVQLRIIHVHDDGTLNGSSKPRAFEALDDDSEMIYAVLSRTAEKFLPLHDKSDPEEIKEYLGLSKSQFKRAVGRLMKNNRVRQEKNKGIFIIE